MERNGQVRSGRVGLPCSPFDMVSGKMIVNFIFFLEYHNQKSRAVLKLEVQSSKLRIFEVVGKFSSEADLLRLE
jgi:hypothetical protein